MADFYNGNQFLKKVGIEIAYTREQIKELIKCSDDVVYFTKNYCKIITLDHGLQLFDPYEYQIRMLKAFEEKRFVVNLLPRQMGKSTVVAAYLLHYAIFNPDKYVGILANKASTAREILGRVQRMYENLPNWIQPGVREWNKGSMVLGNSSTIMAAATSSDSIRGFSFNIIFLDEFAHVEHQAEFWESTYPVISSGEKSKVIITSTPKGMDMFYKVYTDATQGNNNFYPIKVHWSEHPKRDEKWKEETLKNIGYEQFRQEFEVEFLGSSGTLIEGNKLKSLVHQEPLKSQDGLSIYELPDKEKNYVMIVDVSRGKGLDYSAFHIIDVTKMPYRQIVSYRDNMITPIEYAEVLNRVGKYYNECAILIEINDGVGEQISDLLHMEFEYESVLFTESAGRSGKRISTGFSGKNIDKGIRTTKNVKSQGCSMLKLLIEQDQLIINDFETIAELSTFSRRGSSYEAEQGKHDDLAMCLVLFAWLSDQRYFKEITDINTLAYLRNKTDEQLMDELVPFGIIDDGMEEIREQKNAVNWFDNGQSGGGGYRDSWSNLY